MKKIKLNKIKLGLSMLGIIGATAMVAPILVSCGDNTKPTTPDVKPPIDPEKPPVVGKIPLTPMDASSNLNGVGEIMSFGDMTYNQSIVLNALIFDGADSDDIIKIMNVLTLGEVNTYFPTQAYLWEKITNKEHLEMVTAPITFNRSFSTIKNEEKDNELTYNTFDKDFLYDGDHVNSKYSWSKGQTISFYANEIHGQSNLIYIRPYFEATISLDKSSPDYDGMTKKYDFSKYVDKPLWFSCFLTE